MYNPEIMKALEAAPKGRYTARALHDAFGIDYNRPFFARSIAGRFTVNQILKAIDAAGIDPSKAVNIVLIRDASRPNSYRGEWHAVTISAAGRVDIEHRDKYYSAPTTRKESGFDWFCRKADFEDLRKSSDAAAVIISQQIEHLHKTAPVEIDRAGAVERYKLIDVHFALESIGGRRYVHDITIQSRSNAGTRHNIESHGRIIYAGAEYPADPSEIIDKSGYFVKDRRKDLQRRARALKAEREKAAYIQTDDRERVKELERLLSVKQLEASRAIMAAETYEEMKAAGKLIDDYKTGLIWSFYALERYKQNTAEKKYSSIDAATRAYNEIRARLTPAPTA